ncbi:hypothetical protein LAZ67_11001233 [Cordylochernes scorpioides]|uniref:Transposase n=1 Tax=Cordylochernes scorpioides TaxID=51811 RepID=A0ABY6KYC0_9ARAC|nr:hypothetical protein LAZ67_11001233 [Cordylochernes scorpioides]
MTSVSVFLGSTLAGVGGSRSGEGGGPSRQAVPVGQKGRQNVHDDERSGSPVTATDNAAVAAVRNVVKADRRVTIDEIMIRMPPGIEIRRSSIGTIMSDVLNFRKVCARWVPRLLLENHKQQRMEAARAFLEMHQRDGDQLFSRIITGDEIWVHLSTPETKRQSMVWKKPEESAPKKAKVTISAGKVMAMENFKWEIFTHYSPELAPSDFHLYPALKWHLGGKHFANDDEVQAEANHWLRRQDTAWYNSGILKLLQRYQKCLDRNEGRQNVHDDERSGSPVTATDNAAVAAVRNVVKADRRVTIDEIMIRMPPGIEIRRSSIGTIMSDVLNFRKVCARWVPRLLLENHKQQRMEAARAFLEMHQRDGDQLFSRIITGDEIWVHLSTPETKRQSMVWKKPEESAPKKAKVTISAGKVMAMENFKWEIFTHYSPELAPSDFHLYPALKWHLGGKHFANDDEVQAEANHWLRRQDTAWYNSGILKLLQRYQKCLDRNGDYLEW